MDVLRRSSVFAAEVLDVFDRSLTEKELVSQSKALCRDYILSRINQNGLGWSKSELNLSPSNAALSEVSLVLLCLGERNPTHRSFCQSACEIPGQGLRFLLDFEPHKLYISDFVVFALFSGYNSCSPESWSQDYVNL